MLFGGFPYSFGAGTGGAVPAAGGFVAPAPLALPGLTAGVPVAPFGFPAIPAGVPIAPFGFPGVTAGFPIAPFGFPIAPFGFGPGAALPFGGIDGIPGLTGWPSSVFGSVAGAAPAYGAGIAPGI